MRPGVIFLSVRSTNSDSATLKSIGIENEFGVAINGIFSERNSFVNV